jgi:iron(III) transport system ATP-binding protein
MRVEISSLVREAGATTVYITHDQAEAFALADHIGILQEGVLVQAGTPEDVYNHPATPFVARFTGLAGELRVRVAAHGGDGTLEIVAADGVAGRLPALRPVGAAPESAGAAPGSAGTGPGPAGADVRTLGRGDGALLAIRPTGVSLAHTEADERHLTGRVADVAFRGRGYEYAIDLPGLGRLTGVFARHRASRGDEVGLRLDPEGCHLFADDATPADGAASADAAIPVASALTA